MTELEFDHMLDDELKLRANQIGIPGELNDALGMLAERMAELSGNPMPILAMEHRDLDLKLEAIFTVRTGHIRELTSVISDLKEFPLLYAICYWIDRAGAVVLFWDDKHTISYNIAIRAKAGEQWAIDCCSALNLLSPDHCAWALRNEGLLRLP